MSTLVSRQQFLQSEKATILRKELQAMEKDPAYNTYVRYTLVASNGSQFVNKHMTYMANHLQMDHSQYVSNVKLMTKLRK
jgi:hypothetical protein